MDSEPIYLDWAEIVQITGILYRNIYIDLRLKRLEVTRIFGIPRGGLIPAVMLSHLLNVPVRRRFNPKKAEETLVVDDIYDTGETLSKFSDSPQVVLYAKVEDLTRPHLPEYIGRTCALDDWIVFPWETSSSTYKVLNERFGFRKD